MKKLLLPLLVACLILPARAADEDIFGELEEIIPLKSTTQNTNFCNNFITVSLEEAQELRTFQETILQDNQPILTTQECNSVLAWSCIYEKLQQDSRLPGLEQFCAQFLSEQGLFTLSQARYLVHNWQHFPALKSHLEEIRTFRYFERTDDGKLIEIHNRPSFLSQFSADEIDGFLWTISAASQDVLKKIAQTGATTLEEKRGAANESIHSLRSTSPIWRHLHTHNLMDHPELQQWLKIPKERQGQHRESIRQNSGSQEAITEKNNRRYAKNEQASNRKKRIEKTRAQKAKK